MYVLIATTGRIYIYIAFISKTRVTTMVPKKYYMLYNKSHKKIMTLHYYENFHKCLVGRDSGIQKAVQSQYSSVLAIAVFNLNHCAKGCISFTS